MQDLIVEERTAGDIAMVGGNDFKLISPDVSIGKKVLKKVIWAYSDGHDLFINGFHFGQQLWYAKVDVYGFFLGYQGCIASGEAVAVAYTTGAIGAAATSSKRYLYAFNTDNGLVGRVDKHSMPLLLTDYPELHAAYEQEKHRNSTEILVNYLELLNGRIRAQEQAGTQ